MKYSKLVAAVGLLVGLCLSSQADILLPGDSGLDNPVDRLSSSPNPVLVTPYSFGNVNGDILSGVIRNDPINPFGGLTFLYQIQSTGPAPVTQFSVPGFGFFPGVPVEATWLSTQISIFNPSFPNGLTPTVSRSTGAGDVINFNFPVGVPAGLWSIILIINTPYQDFGLVGGSVSTADSNTGLLLLGPVPEPSTFIAGALLFLPLGASTLKILRKSSWTIRSYLRRTRKPGVSGRSLHM